MVLCQLMKNKTVIQLSKYLVTLKLVILNFFDIFSTIFVSYVVQASINSCQWSGKCVSLSLKMVDVYHEF